MFKKKNREEPEPEEDDEDDVDYVQFKGPIGGETPDLSKFGKLTQAALIPAKDMVTDAILRRAELLRLETKGSVTAVRIFVDGIGYPGGKMPARQAAAIIQMLKVLAGLPPRSNGQPVSGGLRAELDDVPYELRMKTEPATPVERLTLRLANTKKVPSKPDDLGISTGLRDQIRAFSRERQKLLVVCGPPMSGLTTSTEGVLASIDFYIQSIFLVASLQKPNPMMSTFEAVDDEDLPTTLQRIMRREPDVIYLGEIDGPEKVTAAAAFAEDVAFVAELSARDGLNGISRLIEMSDAETVANTLGAAVGVKLIRKLCESCRMAFRPNPKMLAKVGLPRETKTLYRAGSPGEDEEPCEDCGGTGYLGRIGMFEFISVDDDVCAAIRGGDPAAIRAAVKAQGGTTFQSEALRLVAEGETALEEVQRTFRR
ncbi:MAG: ATPase, T2SS/T4P/T4SS family [Planctomycetota bacterium]